NQRIASLVAGGWFASRGCDERPCHIVVAIDPQWCVHGGKTFSDDALRAPRAPQWRLLHPGSGMSRSTALDGPLIGNSWFGRKKLCSPAQDSGQLRDRIAASMWRALNLRRVRGLSSVHGQYADVAVCSKWLHVPPLAARTRFFRRGSSASD